MPVVAPIVGTVTGICIGSTTTLTDATPNGVWSTSTPLIGSIDSAGVVTGLSAGTGIVIYTVTDNNGCTNFVTASGPVYALPVIAPIVGTVSSICVGGTTTLTDATPGGIWSTSTPLVGSINNAGLVTGLSAGNGIVIYTVTDSNGCVNAVTASGPVYDLPIVNPISGDSSVCIGTTINLSNSTPDGVWFSSDINSATISNTGVLSGLASGNTVISYTVTNANNCSTTVAKTIVIKSPSTSTTNVTACSSYTWNGSTYTTSGTYTYSTLNALGCDSTATLILTVNYPSTSSTNVTACSSYTWNGNTYIASGTFTYSTTNAVGCDSTATLILTITNGTSSITNASICSGSSYTFNGQTYTSTGTYLAFLTNAAGCDSVATLNLTVNQPTASTSNISICDGSSYTFNGHTYNTTGTYLAFLTNAAGCDSVATLNLTITSIAQSTVQPIIGTSAVCPGDSTILANSTLGGIWSVDSSSIATVDSITGLVKGLVQGSAVVSYTVGIPGTACSATVSVPFTVNCEAVASGATGGLESKGLGDAVAKRVYNAAISSTNNNIDYSRLTPVKTNNIIQVMGTTTPGSISLTDVMPTKESIGSGYKTFDMSSYVADLTSFTNATEVAAYDYRVNNVTKGVTFLTRTYNNIYAHTKTVCDRLKEAKILDIQPVAVQGMTFIQYKLQQNDGKLEYAISFSAGVKQNDNKYTIQSIWLTRNYAIQDTMYNFQVWSVEPKMTQNMVNNILTKLNGILPVNQAVDSIGIPSTYITDVTRTANKLIMNVRNNSSSTNGTISLTIRGNENMTTTAPLNVPVTLLPNAVTPVTIDVKDSYESDISLLVDNNLKDMAYMNDGNWNYNLSNAANKPNSFTISNDGIMPANDEYRLFRNVTIDANVPDYVSLYKMMKAGGLSRDVSTYNQLKFKASATGTGKLTIMLQKASITNWSEQYTYTMPVNGDLNDYAVNLRDFKSTGTNDTLTADDIVTVTFSFIGSGNNNHIVATLADVKFAKASIAAPATVVIKTMTVYPNPAIDNFKVKFAADKDAKLNLKLIEIATGKVVMVKEVNAVVGENIVKVEVNTYINSDGHYVLTLSNEATKYAPFKMAIRK